MSKEPELDLLKSQVANLMAQQALQARQRRISTATMSLFVGFGLAFGAGGAVGALLAGHFWNSYSSETSFLIASGIALVATLFAVSKVLQFGYLAKPKSAT